MVPNTDKSANQTVEQSYNRIPYESFSALLSPVTYAGDQAGSRESRSSRAAESEQITQKSKRRKKKEEIKKLQGKKRGKERRCNGRNGKYLFASRLANGQRVIRVYSI